MKTKKVAILLLTVFTLLNIAFPVFAAGQHNPYIFLDSIIEVAVTFCRYGGVLLGCITIWDLLTSMYDNNSLKQTTARKLFTVSFAMLIVSISLYEITHMFINVITSLFAKFN